MKHHDGFSLIELMVTLAVAAILLSVGVPSFAEFIRNNRLAAGTNNLVAAMQVARAEAIRRGEPITLCASADPAASAVSCTGATAWVVRTSSSSWTAFAQAIPAPPSSFRSSTTRTCSSASLRQNIVVGSFVSYLTAKSLPALRWKFSLS